MIAADARADSYLGRGFDDIPGRPFGWAWNQERAEIRAHLKARGRWRDTRDEFLVSRIQTRLNRNRPTMRERQAAWRARQAPATPAPEPFTRDELERLVDLFGNANDPITAAIGAKAALLLEAAQL